MNGDRGVDERRGRRRLAPSANWFRSVIGADAGDVPRRHFSWRQRPRRTYNRRCNRQLISMIAPAALSHHIINQFRPF